MAGFISLADAKAHLKAETDEEDTLIGSYVDAAAVHIERLTGWVAEDRAETFKFDRFCGALELRLRPLDTDSIEVSYLDGNGDAQPFTDFRATEKNGSVRLVPAVGSSWPSVANTLGAVTVTADVGFGATSEAGAANAPDTLKQATRLCVGHWHLNREGVVTGTTSTELPLAVDMLIRDERLNRL